MSDAYGNRVNMRKNIYWDDDADEKAKRLAFERGISVSDLLRQLVDAEWNDARVAPTTPAPLEPTPGMQRLRETAKKLDQAGQKNLEKAKELKKYPKGQPTKK